MLSIIVSFLGNQSLVERDEKKIIKHLGHKCNTQYMETQEVLGIVFIRKGG